MQKKIIALAVAGLVSGAAFAQTNVTVYGAVDMAYVYQGNIGKNTGFHNNDITGHYNALDSGGWDDSWFGLKGSEDLGNGMTASFQQEFGVNTDVKGGATYQRESFVQLGGASWGSVQAGNFFIDNVNFNTKGGYGAQGWGKTVITPTIAGWASNAVRYNSPTWSGFDFSVGYSSNFGWNSPDVNPNKPWLRGIDTDDNNRTWWGSANYKNGGLYLGASYLDMTNKALNYDMKEWQVGVGYDFKVANVGLMYGNSSVENYRGRSTIDPDRNAWRLNVGVPITAKDIVYLSYTQSDLNFDRNTFRDEDANAFGVSYAHSLSKRTKLYAEGYVANAKDGFATTADDHLGSQIYQNGIKLGMRHEF